MSDSSSFGWPASSPTAPDIFAARYARRLVDLPNEALAQGVGRAALPPSQTTGSPTSSSVDSSLSTTAQLEQLVAAAEQRLQERLEQSLTADIRRMLAGWDVHRRAALRRS